MKILVCIKQVPDTETQIKLAPDGRTLDESAIKWILSPYDEFALEQALRLREAAAAGEVVVVTAGRESAQTTLRQALAIGADRAVLVQDARYDRCDALTRARALAAVARAEGSELVLAGKYGVGADEWQTPPIVAELLDWPHASGVSQLHLEAGSFTAHREVEGAVEVQQGTLPAVISCDEGLNEPRYASLKGIMAAKKKPLEVKTPEQLGLDPQELAEPRLVWDSLAVRPSQRTGRLLQGPAPQAAEELARLLREEAKVI
jgi:electron transfer flavoprotein beta subunit